MSDRSFEYNEELLSSCARSQLARFVATSDVTEEEMGWQLHLLPEGNVLLGADESCSILHQQHEIHYNRPPPHKSSFRIIEPTITTKDSRKDETSSTTTENVHNNYRIDGRLRRFVQSVLFIHNHNSNSQNLHRLALNQFADQEFPASQLTQQQLDLDVQLEGGSWDSLLVDYDSLEKEWIFSPLEQAITTTNNVLGDYFAANLTVGHGGMGHLDNGKRKKDDGNNNNKRIQDSIAEKVKFPDRGSDPHFALPSIDDPDLDGDLLKVKPRRRVEKELQHGGLDKTDQFGRHLNWATQDNPDGVSIVKDAFDQGECGSCWAFAAAGSLEASVSRRQARDAYNEFLEKASLRRERKSIVAIHQEAVDFARSVEVAAFQMANLSIQELIDCDTAADQGCIGGNPLLAFYFIHRYGLSSWGQYPYSGYEDTCHKKWVSHPVAKVKAWGIISPNHESHMELVLRFIGPIAVGVNGAERSFLAYQEGIFDKPSCRQGANHALLIVGYGQEETEDGDIVKYWIARNSWGKGWGEDGFVRIKRGSGQKGVPGVCGIARSPSVALGGVLLANRHRLAPYHAPRSSEPGSSPLSTSESTTFCVKLGFDSCSSILDGFESHRALVLGLTGIMCATFLAVWPLTFQCRRRRNRRRAQREIVTRDGLRSVEDQNCPAPPPPPPTETDPLLGDPLCGNRKSALYGG